MYKYEDKHRTLQEKNMAAQKKNENIFRKHYRFPVYTSAVA